MTNEERKDIAEYVKNHYTCDAETGSVYGVDGKPKKGRKHWKGYLRMNIYVKGKLYAMKAHQMVWILTHGYYPKEIDHINGIKTDNRPANLREATGAENSENRVFRWKPRGDGFAGVNKEKDGRYRVENCGKRLSFRTPEEAFATLVLFGRMFDDMSQGEADHFLTLLRQLEPHRQALTDDEWQSIGRQLAALVRYMEQVQQMPLLLRLTYCRCVADVYDFLRKTKQLGRREGAFSESVKSAINGLFN